MLDVGFADARLAHQPQIHDRSSMHSYNFGPDESRDIPEPMLCLGNHLLMVAER
jgi:hypothetical protein